MNRRKAAVFLFGGVLVMSLLVGVFFYERVTFVGGINDCVELSGSICPSGPERFNISDRNPGCQLGPDNAEEVRELDSVEAVNESTGMVKCRTD